MLLQSQALTEDRVELFALKGVPLVKPGDDLCALLLDGVRTNGLSLRDGDVVVLAQKIVSKAQSRYVELASVEPSELAFKLAANADKDPRVVELILRESKEVLRCVPGVVVVETKQGFVLANAGIDRSNVEQPEKGIAVLLLPEDPDATCEELRRALRQAASVDVGVIINDSLGRAWRNGTIGTALGVSGLPALQDLRGIPDLFGEQLRSTEVGIADEIAAAASLVMGQSGEGRPIVLVRGVRYQRSSGSGRDLVRSREKDLFR